MSKIEIDLEFCDADDLMRQIEIIQAIVNIKKIQEQQKEIEIAQRNYKKSPKKAIMDTILELDELEESTIPLPEEPTTPQSEPTESKSSDKVKCECGVDVLPKNKKRHMSSKTHTNYFLKK
jgi:hypothetical protein